MKIFIAITSTIISMLIFFLGLPYIRGYKFFYSTSVNYDYEAISAYGQWVSALIPIALVFLSIYATNRFDKTKRVIDQQNIATVEYVNEMIREHNLSVINKSSPVNSSELENPLLKDKAFKYISIAGLTNTDTVAKHLGISKEEAFDLLNELLRVDDKISAGGRATKENIDNVLWLKKKR